VSAFIHAAKRTPIGSFLGVLADVPAPRLGAAALQAACGERTVEQVWMGNVLQAGQGQAPARQAVIYAGLGEHVGAVTVHKVCGSGMRAVMDASNALSAGEFEWVAAGGMESMSQAPYLLSRLRQGRRMGHFESIDAMIHDGLWDPYANTHMGSCAELCAAKYGFTRAAQDAFAITSYQRAQAADFSAECTAVAGVDRDEEPTRARLEKMPVLKPAFAKDGTITAANASKLNDGAAALLLARSGDGALARVVAYASVAQAPEWFTTAPVAAARAVLAKAGLSTADIDLWEINEAFAVVAMAAIRDLDLDPERVNVHGGAVALGHPIGCSGARILTTLVHAMGVRRARYGLASICIGGGEATAMILERA
jgi:acetyl-CoA C-acetyltransferase